MFTVRIGTTIGAAKAYFTGTNVLRNFGEYHTFTSTCRISVTKQPNQILLYVNIGKVTLLVITHVLFMMFRHYASLMAFPFCIFTTND